LSNMPKVKMNLCRIIEALPDKEALALELFAKFLISQVNDPVLKMLLTSEEVDESLSKEEEEGAKAGWQEYLNGMSRPWGEVRKDLLGDE
jgi:hypothetical protein